MPRGLLRQLAAVAHAAKQLRRKLGDDTDHPTYILTEPRFDYRMAKEETVDEGEPAMYPLS